MHPNARPSDPNRLIMRTRALLVGGLVLFPTITMGDTLPRHDLICTAFLQQSFVEFCRSDLPSANRIVIDLKRDAPEGIALELCGAFRAEQGRLALRESAHVLQINNYPEAPIRCTLRAPPPPAPPRLLLGR